VHCGAFQLPVVFQFAPVNGPFMHGGTFCPAGRMSADISKSKRWKKLRFYDFALTSIVYKMA